MKILININILLLLHTAVTTTVSTAILLLKLKFIRIFLYSIRSSSGTVLYSFCSYINSIGHLITNSALLFVLFSAFSSRSRYILHFSIFFCFLFVFVVFCLFLFFFIFFKTNTWYQFPGNKYWELFFRKLNRFA